MKRIYLLTTALLATLATASCSLTTETERPSLGKEIRFTSSMGSFTVKAGDTEFDYGDEIGLYAMEPVNRYGVKLTSHGNQLVPDQNVYWGEGQTEASEFIAYYPYNPDFVPTRFNYFSVRQDQADYSDYTKSDLMAAVTWGSPKLDNVHFEFNHMLSKIIVLIDSQLASPIYSVVLEGIGTTAEVNIPTEEVNPISYSESISLCPTVINGREAWMGILPPQEAKAQIRIYTADGSSILLGTDGTVYFPKGCSTSAIVTLNGTNPSIQFTGSINDWNWGGEYIFTDIDDNSPAQNNERWYNWGIVGEMNDWGEWEIQMEWNDQIGGFLGLIDGYNGEMFKIRANNSWDYNYGAPWVDGVGYYQALIPNGNTSFSAIRDGMNILVDINSFPNFSGTLAVIYYLEGNIIEVLDATFLPGGSEAPTTVEEALNAEDGTWVDIQPGIVVATCARGFVIMDEVEAAILVYQGANPEVTVNIGDVVRVRGTKTTYSGGAEIQDNLSIQVVSSVERMSEGEVTSDNLFEFLADYPGYLNITDFISDWGAYASVPVEVTGILFDNSITVEGTARKVSLYWPVDNFSKANGHVVTVRGFAVQYNDSSISVMLNTIEIGEEFEAPDIIDISLSDFSNVTPSSTQRYRISGIVDEIENSTYGNLYISDETGFSVYVYGLTATELGYGAYNDKSFGSLGIEVGDYITIVGYPNIYKQQFEMTYAYLESVIKQ